jgi:hypothetical protein
VLAHELERNHFFFEKNFERTGHNTVRTPKAKLLSCCSAFTWFDLNKLSMGCRNIDFNPLFPCAPSAIGGKMNTAIK